MNKTIITSTLKLLDENPEWEERYMKYLSLTPVGAKTNRFWWILKGLTVFTPVDRSAGSKYDLYFEGMRVGSFLLMNGKPIFVHPFGNMEKLGLELPSKHCGWYDADAVKFRSYFKELGFWKTIVHTERPREQVRDRLLYELSKRTKTENKHIYNIRPIKFHGGFIRLYVPVKIGDKVYVKSYLGVDILARIKMDNGRYRLCVMMTLDKNNKNESQSKFIEEIIPIAVFVAKLLRSKSGQGWWAHFMSKKTGSAPVPGKLEIDVVTVMPQGHSEEFCDKEINIPELGTTFHCHSLYYNQSDYRKGQFSFSGTYSLKMIKS